MNYIQITAGRGPAECARVVTLVARELLKAIPSAKIIENEPHNRRANCYMSITLGTHEEISEHIKLQWEGSVLWRSTSNSIRPGHKRCNWFVGVHFFTEIELPRIEERDIMFETCRSGGKGGQNVNKVESAVRAVHLPSGLSVRCSDERSQHQNKALARERLILKLHQLNVEAMANARTELWTRHDSLERGNPVRRFCGPL